MNDTTELHIPSDERAERGVLGAILVDPDCFQRAVGEVDSADFHSDANGRIFDACRVLSETGVPPDLVTVPDQLERDGALALVGGVAYVASLANGLPDSANVEHYARIVRACAYRRRLLHLGQSMMAAAAGGNGSSETVLATVKAEMTAALAEGATPAPLALAGLWLQAEAGYLTTPPPRRNWLLTQPESQGGHGLLPRSKVGLLAAEGGSGKTALLIALAVCAITGRPWLGYYQVPVTVTGRVLLLLAEEDGDDVHRRLWKIAEALKLTDSERALVAARLVVIPLAGRSVALTAVSGTGLIETPFAVALRNQLVREAGEDGWALVGLDPLSRFAGGDVEGSNEAATRFVELLESLTTVPGHPTVLLNAHSSKLARRQGQSDVRGVSGLSDAARWVGTMRREGEEVIFAVAKSNYALPCQPLRLRWHDETLVAVSGAEILDAVATARNTQDAELDEDVRRVVEVLTREGTMTSRDTIATTARMKLTRGRAALDLAIARGLVTQSGTDRRRSYAAVPEACATRPPHTPPRPGRTDGLASIRPDSEWDGPGRTGTAGRTEEGEAS